MLSMYLLRIRTLPMSCNWPGSSAIDLDLFFCARTCIQYLHVQIHIVHLGLCMLTDRDRYLNHPNLNQLRLKLNRSVRRRLGSRAYKSRCLIGRGIPPGFRPKSSFDPSLSMSDSSRGAPESPGTGRRRPRREENALQLGPRKRP